MARDGSGNYTLPAGNPVSTGGTISSTWANNTMTDIGSALTQSVSKDGQTAYTGNQPMGGNKHTNVGNATARNEYAALGQVQDGAGTYLTSVSGTNTITAAVTGLAAYAAGQVFRFIAAGANTGAVTLNINALGAKAITKQGTTALVSGDIVSGSTVVVVYDGTQFQLINQVATVASQTVATLTATSDVSAQVVNAPVVNATGTSSSAGVVRLFEDTDNGTNYVELKAPATLAANRSFVLPDADGTVQQFLKTDGSGNLAFASTLTRGTLVVATGQLELAFINVPSWAKRISLIVSQMSVTGSVDIKLQLGTGGSYATTGYVSRTVSMNTTPAIAVATHTAGFSVQAHNNNTFKYDGSYVLSLLDAATNLWTCSGAITSSSTSNLSMIAGHKSLSGAIDRLRLYIDGTQTFDAGSVNILYE